MGSFDTHITLTRHGKRHTTSSHIFWFKNAACAIQNQTGAMYTSFLFIWFIKESLGLLIVTL